ncbi:MAG: hypothetical protein ABIQ51_21940 [Mesorhizobium sp.]
MVIGNIIANLASMILSARYEAGRRLAIPTAKDRPSRYDRADWPKGIVSGVLDAMAGAGWIVRHPSVLRQRQTTIEPSRTFHQVVQHCGVTRGDIGRLPGGETIWLMARTGEDGFADQPAPKERQDYSETPDSRRYRGEMERINAHLNAASITFAGEHQGPIFLRRSFMLRHPDEPQPRRSPSRTFRLNGRLVSGFWENLSSKDRYQLRIDGQEVADLDFSAMFINLSYIRKALPLPDPATAYRIPGLEEHRDGAKAGLLSLLSRRGPMKQLSAELKGLLPDGWTARQFTHAATAHHADIADLFGADRGVEFMFAESQILVALLLRLNAAGITALPLHDGIMLAVSHKENALAAMVEVSLHVVGTALPAREKAITRPAASRDSNGHQPIDK